MSTAATAREEAGLRAEVRDPRPTVLVAVTHPKSAILVRGQLAHVRRSGFRVLFLSSPGEPARTVAREEGVELVEIPMEREISPLRDLVSLARVAALLVRAKPELVNAGTAKAGLLVLLAAWLTRVPHRIYTMRGLRSDGASGVRRRLLLGVERLTCALAHRVICVGHLLRDRAVSVGVVGRERTVVLGQGSSNGVDVERFAPTPERAAAAYRLRGDLGIGADAPVVGFVGRLVRDKGIHELAAAWESLRGEFPALRLLLVGPHEECDPVSPEVVRGLEDDPRTVLTGHVADPAPFLHAMDLVVLPSHREGFNNTVLEAAASARPVVTTRIPGCEDAVVDGDTGLLVDRGDEAALAAAIRRYLRSPGLRREHGENGRARAAREFRRERIWDALVELYRCMLAPGPVANRPASSP